MGFTCTVRESVAKRGVDDAEEDALRQTRYRLGPALVQLPQRRETRELAKREGQHHLKGGIPSRGREDAVTTNSARCQQIKAAAAADTTRERAS